MQKWILQFLLKRQSFWKGVKEVSVVAFLIYSNTHEYSREKWFSRVYKEKSFEPRCLDFPFTSPKNTELEEERKKNRKRREKKEKYKTNMALFRYTQNSSTSAVLQKCSTRKQWKKKERKIQKRSRTKKCSILFYWYVLISLITSHGGSQIGIYDFYILLSVVKRHILLKK